MSFFWERSPICAIFGGRNSSSLVIGRRWPCPALCSGLAQQHPCRLGSVKTVVYCKSTSQWTPLSEWAEHLFTQVFSMFWKQTTFQLDASGLDISIHWGNIFTYFYIPWADRHLPSTSFDWVAVLCFCLVFMMLLKLSSFAKVVP